MSGTTLLLLIDACLFIALIYYIWKVDQLKESSDESGQPNAEMKTKQRQLQNTKNELSEVKEQLSERKKELSYYKEQFQSTKEELEEVRTRLEDENEKEKDRDTDVSEIREKLNTTEKKLQKKTEERDQLMEERNELEKERDELKEALNQQKSKLQSARDKMKNLETKLSTRDEELQEARKQINRLQNQLDQARRAPSSETADSKQENHEVEENPQTDQQNSVNEERSAKNNSREDDAGPHSGTGTEQVSPPKSTNAQITDAEENPAELKTPSKQLLKKGLLPAWNRLHPLPDLDNLRNVYDVFGAPNEFQLASFSVGEECKRMLNEFGEDEIIEKFRDLSSLRSEIKDQLSDSLFQFYEHLSVKGKTITQLERNDRFPEYPFWKWYLNEKVDLTLTDPEFVNQRDFHFQNFLDHVIKFRDGDDSRTREFANSLFKKITETVSEQNEEENPLERMDRVFSSLPKKLDKIDEQVRRLKSTLNSRIEATVDAPSVNEENLQSDELFQKFRSQSRNEQ